MTIIRESNIATRLAIKGNMHATACWLLLLLAVVVVMAIQFSPRQPETVALDVGLSVMRIALPLFIILLTQELFSKEFERKLYLRALTYPRSRGHWLFGRMLSIFLLSFGLLFLMATTLALLTLYAGSDYDQSRPVSLGIPYMVTLGFITVDMLVVIAIAILLAVSATTPSFVLIGTLGFLIIARSYTPIIELLQNSPQVISEFADPHIYQDSLGLISFFLPDLGRLDVRMIALYNQMAFLPADWPLLLLASLVYALALIALAVWVLNKREFQ